MARKGLATKAGTRINDAARNSWVGRYFELGARKTTFLREVRAGVTTFLTVAYIIAVNPLIISSSGGPCTVHDCTGPEAGTAACLNPATDPGYAMCVQATSDSLVAATCISAAIACFLTAFVANMPLVVAPGMGVNAFFAYQMVGQYGSGQLTYAEALAVVLVVALVVLLAACTSMRGRLMMLFPKHLMFAMVVGLGLFLAMTGYQAEQGIGLVVDDGTTLVALGGCPAANRVASAPITGSSASDICILDGSTPEGLAFNPNMRLTSNFACKGGALRSGATWLGIAASLLMVLLMAGGAKAAIGLGVLFATIIAWIPGHDASYLGGPPGSPGAQRLEVFKQVVSVPNPTKTSLQIDFHAFKKPVAWSNLFGLFYLVFLDATGTTFALAEMINHSLPGFASEGYVFPRRLATLVVDATSSIPGALMGCANFIPMVESSVAVELGGRTGLVPLVVGTCFALSMFFAPLMSNIPPYATGPALVVVGCMMVSTARFINWEDIREAFPSFLTLSIMPFTYSISNGIIAGLLAEVLLWVLDLVMSLVRAVIAKDPDKPPSLVLHSKFAVWRTAFGDVTWAGYTRDLKETFTRATTLPNTLSHTFSRTLSRTLSLTRSPQHTLTREMSKGETARSGPLDAVVEEGGVPEAQEVGRSHG